MRELNVCASCGRYVYVDESACPFCGSDRARLEGSGRLAGRLSRAAGYAARAALVVSAVACSESHDATTDAATPADAAIADAGAVDAQPVDAGAPADAAADAAPGDASADDASVADAGTDGDVPVPLYGGVFPDPRKRAVV